MSNPRTDHDQHFSRRLACHYDVDVSGAVALTAIYDSLSVNVYVYYCVYNGKNRWRATAMMGADANTEREFR